MGDHVPKSAKPMQLSKRGIAMLKNLEGTRLTPEGDHIVYDDKNPDLPPGVLHKDPSKRGTPTIAWGITGQGIGENYRRYPQTLTEDKADMLFRHKLAPYSKHVAGELKNIPNQNQFDAMVIFAYNIGKAGFSESTALKEYNKGNLDNVGPAMQLWNKVENKDTGELEVWQGLVNRRNAEFELFYEPPTESLFVGVPSN